MTSRRRGNWIVPKGNRSSRLADSEAARREALEEGGVSGVIRGVPIGTYKHRRNGRKHKITIYSLLVDRQHRIWIEQNERRRLWCTPEEAIRLVRQKDLRKFLSRF